MTRIRLALAFPLCLVLLLASLACTPSVLQLQAAAADALARSVNAAAPLLVSTYEADCGHAVDVAAPGEGKTALAACRERWRPAWQALEALAAAQDAWAVAIVAGKTGDWSGLVAAGCDALRVVRVLAPKVSLPLLGGVCQ